MTAFVLFALLAQAQQHSEPQAVLRARFVLAETGEPIAGVTVDLALRPPSARWEQSARSNDDGVVRFERLAAGTYQLFARKTGYLSVFMSIALATNQSREELTFRFRRHGVFSGTVTDPDGNPVAGAFVTAWRDTWVEGRRTLSQVDQTTTDDRGQYRLFGLAAARYVLGAFRPGPDTPAGELELASTTYYPSGTQPSEAARLALRWGQEWNDLHLVLRPYTSYSIRGVIADAARGGPCRTCLLRIERVEQGIAVPLLRRFGASPDGSFRASGLLPGNYRVIAESAAPAGHVAAARTITLGNRNLDGVHLVVGTDRAIRGRVVLDPVPEKLNVSVTLVDGVRPVARARVNPDLTFELRGLAPIPYRILVSGLPDGAWFQALRTGGQDLPAPEIEIPEDSGLAPLELVIARDSATLSGSVQPPESAGRGHRVTSATIALYPQENQSPYLVERRVATDSSGGFILTGIAPGAYTVFALPAGGSLEWDDPDVRRQYARYGRSVDLGEGKKVTVELVLAPESDLAQ